MDNGQTHGSFRPPLDKFTLLRDAPDTYTGQAHKLVRVNTSADGLEFTVSDAFFIPVSIGSDYEIPAAGYEVLVDANAGSRLIKLPVAIGGGGLIHVKKIDDTANVVTVAAHGGDLIDDSSSTVLVRQWADVLLVDAAFGYWDNTGGADPIVPISTRPTTLNEVIAAGVTLGLWP